MLPFTPMESFEGRVRPLLRTEYDQLVEAGAFEEERIQLLEGALVEMSPQGAPHAVVLRMLTDVFSAVVRPRYLLGVQTPLAATVDSEPEPDISVIPVGDYSRGHPHQAVLVIEVASKSLRIDLGMKTRIYARAGVRDYWVIDLKHGQVIVHRQPSRSDQRYKQVRTYNVGDRIAPLAFPKLKLEVGLLLGESAPRH